MWSQFKEEKASDLIIGRWPATSTGFEDEKSEHNMDFLQKVITAVRSIRSRMNVPPAKLSALLVRCSQKKEEFLRRYETLLKSLSRIETIEYGKRVKKPQQSATAVVSGMELYIPLGSLVDLDQEKMRMEKRIAEINTLIAGINGKLANDNFINRAPEHIVTHERSNLAKLTDELDKVTSNLEVLQ